MSRWKAVYGATPWHLLGLLACFAVSGLAVAKVLEGPSAVRIGLWFLGAALVHDLVLSPLYLLGDKALVGATRARGASRGAVNWVRVPALLSALLLLMFWPLVLQHSEPAYRTATGLSQDPYLERYLLVVALLFGGSALVFAATRARRRP